MGGAERVVFALAAAREARQAALLAERADAAAPPGDDLVRIGLMADVPDHPVLRRVEDIVQRHRELDHAQAGAEMAAGDRNGRDRLLAQLVGQLAQLVGLQPTDVGRNVDSIEKRRLALPGHGTTILPRVGSCPSRNHEFRCLPQQIGGLAERIEMLAACRAR